ncbi:MAG: preprotein translocase subunit SecY [Bacteroidales bacterium]|nr:preprotein translocase subunit SecY [Bacteroidales bacterium]MBQ3438966.1 preprotein translocase subunit SecY [Bacteroidales bacterium]
MAKFVETIKNIYKIEELRTRIGYTLLLVLVYRLGCYIVLPGLDPEVLKGGISGTQEGLVGLLNMFSGGAFGNASIFALGVMPYISASIVVQLLGMFVPAFRKMQMEGESGRRKMNQITRYLTLAILAIQGPAYVTGMIPRNAIAVGWSGFMFNLISTIVLMAGTMFVMWLGERITDRGIGNGISLIIMIGIVARLPYALVAEIGQKFTGNGVGGPLILVVELVIWFLVIIAAIAIVQAVRKVPVQYAKRVIGNKQYGGVRQYLPLKINAAGVMPIIFAQALMMFPMLLGRWDATRGIAAAFSSYTNVWYNIVFAILVIVFTYFYTAVTVNPTMMAEDMKKNGGFIPGVKPGKKTAEYIDAIMSRITLPGSIALAFIAIMPAFANIFGINNQFASFFGGTSLLITVGVVLDTLQQIESYLLMRHYDGLMKTGRLTGRSGM